MKPLRPSERESVLTRVEFARVELADLAAYKELSSVTYQTDRSVRRNVEHAIENAINAVIDIAKILLAAHETAVPDTYRATLLKMAEIGLSSPEQAAALSEMTTLRNTLAHRYLDYKWQAIKGFLRNGIEIMAAFLDTVESFVQPPRPDSPSSPDPDEGPNAPGV